MKTFICKKRQRQGSNLRSQRETAQQATALTTRPRCLILYCTDTPPYPYSHTTPTLQNFLKKRQWQDLNLRIQRIIDFKSIALDHSATLSSTLLSLIGLLVPMLDTHIHRYIHTHSDNQILTQSLRLIDRYLMPTHMPFPFLLTPVYPPHLPLPTLYSVISNSIVGQYLRLSRERPGFESPLESFYFFSFPQILSTSCLFSPSIVCMGVQLRWQSTRFACEGHGDRYPAPPSFSFFLYHTTYLQYIIHIFTLSKRVTKNDNGRVRTYAPKGKLLSRQPP